MVKLENDKKLKEDYWPYHDNANQITFNITSLRIIHGKAIENLFKKHLKSMHGHVFGQIFFLYFYCLKHFIVMHFL